MVLARKTESRNKSTYIWSVNLLQISQEYTTRKRSFLQQMVVENWTTTSRRLKLTTFLHIHKNKMKTD